MSLCPLGGEGGSQVKRHGSEGIEPVGCLTQDKEEQRTAGQELRTQRVCGWRGRVGAGQGGQAGGSRKGEALGQGRCGAACAGAGLAGKARVLGCAQVCRLPLRAPVLSLALRRLLVPADWSALSAPRSQVNAPAGQDLGAARAPGVRMGTGVTRSRSAEVRGALA